MMRLLVTGANGYVAQHVIAGALSRGLDVRGSLRRSDAGADTPDRMRAIFGPELELVELELETDEGWDEAMRGVDVLVHVASPVPVRAPPDRDAVIGPAVEGTSRALTAAARAGVRRVLLTSSIAAISGHPAGGSRVLTAADWTDHDRPGASAYAVSKARAERRAWELADRLGLELTVLNPGFVFGPPLLPGARSSVLMVARMVRGIGPLVPRITFNAVAARDVADAYFAALERPGTVGQRVPLVARAMDFLEIAQAVRRGAPGAPAPRWHMPNWLARLAMRLNADAREMLAGVGRDVQIDTAPLADLLGRPPTDPAEAVAETARHFAAANYSRQKA